MVGASDLDLALAIALSEDNEACSDDDFKPSKRSVKRDQKLSFRAQKSIRVKNRAQLKSFSDLHRARPFCAKTTKTERHLDDNTRSISPYWSNTSREESGGTTSFKGVAIANLDARQCTTLGSPAEVANFKCERTRSPTSRAISTPVAADRKHLGETDGTNLGEAGKTNLGEGDTTSSIQADTTNSNQAEGLNVDEADGTNLAEADRTRLAEAGRMNLTEADSTNLAEADRTNFGEADAANLGKVESNAVDSLRIDSPKCHPGDCMVINIDSDAILDVSDESQFDILLRLCNEELFPNELDADSEECSPDQNEENCDVGAAMDPDISQLHGTLPRLRYDQPPDYSAKANELFRKISGDLAWEREAVNVVGEENLGESWRQQEEEANERSSSNSTDEIEELADDISSMMTQTRTAALGECAQSGACSEACACACACSSHSDHDEDCVPIRATSTEKASQQTSQICNSVANDAGCIRGIEPPGSCILKSYQSDIPTDADTHSETQKVGPSESTNPAGGSTAGTNIFELDNPRCRPQPADGDHSMCDQKERIDCPVCRSDISENTFEERVAHANSCLETNGLAQECPDERDLRNSSPMPGSDPVRIWLESLSLTKYAHLFEEQEIDWDTLQWLTDEDLFVIGIAAVGPRRKILGALQKMRTAHGERKMKSTGDGEVQDSGSGKTNEKQAQNSSFLEARVLSRAADSSNLITKYYLRPPGISTERVASTSELLTHGHTLGTKGVRANRYNALKRPRTAVNLNTRGIPPWMCIPGTPFRVDAFQYLSGDCSHWFLTHFHTDHYQGLTRGFRYGQIFCSLITARLVNLRIGVAWDKLMVVPLNEKFNIAGVDVTFIDANHCPGAVMILFELPSGEAILHSGDFRFCTEMAENCLLQNIRINTLILDTTYCDPQYDFPSQATVIRFVIDAIQAELFNSGTLFLIGTYTIGKERVFLEVAKALQKYVYVGAAKKKLLDCLDLPTHDTKWLTCNENESFIHVVPIWSISNFKRLSCIAKHYQDRYKVIVAFSPSGWSFGKGKKKTPGKRWQQGTMIRYEVPYSEHCSFSELREFLKYIAPDNVVPSVPGNSCKDGDQMIASLWSEDESSVPQACR